MNSRSRARLGRASTRPVRRAVMALSLGVALLAALAPAADAQNRNFSMRKQVSGAVAMAQVGNSWSRSNNGAIDIDSDATTRVSSSADLSLPAGAVVRWAGLYWGGRASASGVETERRKVRFQAPGASGYTVLGPAGTTLDLGTSDSMIGVFLDVTAEVAAAGSGTYLVGNEVIPGRGGWALVVIYELPGLPPKSVSVFDGLRRFQNSSFTSTVTGLQTPPTGPVRTQVGVIAYEADPGALGDSVSVNGTLLGDSCNPEDDLFNGTHCNLGADITTRNLALTPVRGHDADLLQADGILPNSASSATVRVAAGLDVVFPHVLTFATDFYAPDLRTEKTVTNVSRPGELPIRGDVLEYTIELENQGFDAARAVQVTDPIPAGTTFVPGSITATPGTGSFDAASNRVLINLGQGASASSGGELSSAGGPNTTASATFRVTVGAVPDDTTIRNVADVNYIAVTTNIAQTAQAQVETVAQAPDLTVVKTHSPSFIAGGVSTFRIVVANVGGAPTTDTVTLTDAFPSGLGGFGSIANAGGEGWDCQTIGFDLTCTRTDPLAAGASYPPITVDANVPDPPAATLTNVARVSGGGDQNPSNNAGVDSEGTTAQAALQVNKTGTPGTVLSGNQVEWTVDVTNGGPSLAEDVTLSDALDPGDYADVQVETTRGTCDLTVDCQLGDIARGETVRVTIAATATANDETLVNVATASSPTPNSVPEDATDDAEVVVVNTADVRIDKSASSPTVDAGDPVSYTLEVVNDGPGAASGVVVHDDIPATIQPTSVVAPGFACGALPPAGGTLRCDATGDIADGETRTITVDGTALDVGDRKADNAARVEAQTPDPRLTNNSDLTEQVITPAADLTTTVVPPPTTPVASGADVTFSVVVSNNGPSTSQTPELRYTLPANVTFDAAASSPACSEAAGTVTCTLPSIPSGASSPALTIVVTSGIVGATEVDNVFRAVATTTPDHIPGNNAARARFATGEAADVGVTKTPDVTAPAVGETVTYTLVVSNDGPDSAQQVELTDQLPDGLAFGAFTQNPGDACSLNGTTIECDLGTLAVSGAVTVAYTATPQRPAAGDTLVNTARASTATPDLTTYNDSSPAEIVVDPISDVSVVSGAGPSAATATDLVEFTARVINNGPAAVSSVTLIDTLPDGFTVVSLPPSCSLAGLMVTCDVGPLDVDESRLFVFRAAPTDAAAGAGATHVSQVTSGPQPDDEPANDQDSAALSIGRLVDLQVRKELSPSPAHAGATGIYTITVSNAGPNTADAVDLADALPSGVAPTSLHPTQGSCDLATVTCQLGSIAPGGSAQVLAGVRFDAGLSGQLTNRASAEDPSARERRPSDNRFALDHDVVGQRATALNALSADLRVVKRASLRRATVGQPIAYTIDVTNQGPAAAPDVQLTDALSGRATIRSVRTSAGTCMRRAPVRCSLGTLAAGGSVRVAVVAEPRVDTCRFRNSATVTSDASDPVASNNLDSVVTCVRKVRLAVSKTADKRIVTAGGRVTYTIRVRNSGSGTARAVRVCDRLPAGMVALHAKPGGKVAKGRHCWTAKRIAAGQRKRYRLAVRVLPGASGRKVNTATVTGSGVRGVSRAAPSVRVLPRQAAGGGVTG